MVRSVVKALQLRALDVINCNIRLSRKVLCILILVLPLYTLLLLISLPRILPNVALRARAKCAAPNDNIGNTAYPQVTCMPVIDVVYTWVNGSDPLWLERMMSFKSEVVSGDETGGVGNSSSSSGVDDVAGVHRYRDNGELKYSLRSVEKYAPWVRRVFIVTDNQVPSWLAVSNARVEIVSHQQIFPNVSALPSFSSPAIEANIHRIPGVSKHILYLNDDVLLGAPVMPTDFFTPSGGQKLYLAWDLPSCSEGCDESWVGDGYCDASCNVAECNFDSGDCENQTEFTWYDSGDGGDHRWRSDHGEQGHDCAPSCHTSWMADGTCDEACNVAACLFDLLDCRADMEALRQFPRLYVQLEDTYTDMIRLPHGTESIVIDYSKLQRNESDELTAADVQRSHLVARKVVNVGRKLMLILLRKKAQSAEVSEVWGGSTVCGYERLSGICYSRKKENRRLASCSATFGCERRRTLDAALQLCSVRGEDCEGVTEDHDGQFQTRSGELVPSSLGENSWTKDRCSASGSKKVLPREGCKANATSATALPVITVAFRLSFGVGAQRIYRMTGALDDYASTRHDRRLETLDFSTRVRHLATSIVLNESDGCEGSLAGDESSRRLDTFGDSLRYVNGIYNHAFGHSLRRVPAHMPHFLQRDEIKRMQDRFASEFDETRFHRFRSKQDMQFSFAYMYWLVRQSSLPEMSVNEFFDFELDVDKDGKLNANELRTMVAVAAGSQDLEYTLPAMMSQVQACLNQSILVEMTLEQFKSCSAAVNGVLKHSRRRHAHKVVPEDEANAAVAFEMIGDDLNRTQVQLDSIRARKPKFICVNDDMETAPPETRKALHDFYESLFPLPSQFELPQGETNPELRLKAVNHSQGRQQSMYWFWCLVVLYAFSVVYYFIKTRA